MRKCHFCERELDHPCMNTRDCEDRREEICYDALMRRGGGEYSVNQQESQRRKEVFNKWKAHY